MTTKNRLGLALVLIAFFVLDIARNNSLVQGTAAASFVIMGASAAFCIGIFALMSSDKD